MTPAETQTTTKRGREACENLFIHGKTFPSKFHESDECYITLLLYHRLENKKTDKELSLEILCIGKMQFGVMAKAFSPFLLDDFSAARVAWAPPPKGSSKPASWDNSSIFLRNRERARIEAAATAISASPFV